MEATMRRMTIEAALIWAYCEELPKAGASAGAWFASPMGRVADVGRLGTVVDVNGWGVVTDWGAVDEPHPDAVRLAAAVEGLARLEIGEIDLADVAGDVMAIDADLGLAAAEAALERVAGVGADGSGRRIERLDLAGLVRRQAILGAAPRLVEVVPKLVDVVGPNGRPVWRRRVARPVMWDAAGAVILAEEIEVDVATVNGRVPIGAYRVRALVPDPVAMIASRIVYVAWHEVLAYLAGEVAGDLTAVELVPMPIESRPRAGLWQRVAACMGRARPAAADPKGAGERAAEGA